MTVVLKLYITVVPIEAILWLLWSVAIQPLLQDVPGQLLFYYWILLLWDWAPTGLCLTSCTAFLCSFSITSSAGLIPCPHVKFSVVYKPPIPSLAPHVVVLLTEKEKQEGSSDLVVNKMSSELGHSEVELSSEWKCTTGRRQCRSGAQLMAEDGYWESPA